MPRLSKLLTATVLIVAVAISATSAAPTTIKEDASKVGSLNPLCDETCQNIANEAMILCYGPFGSVNPICADTVEAQEEACKAACFGAEVEAQAPAVKAVIQAAPVKDDDNPCDQACENVANAQMLLCYTGPFGSFNPICTGEVEDELNACKSLCGNGSSAKQSTTKKNRSAIKRATVKSNAAVPTKRVASLNPLCDETCQNIANAAMILCYTGPFGGVNPICVDTVEAQEEACKTACFGARVEEKQTPVVKKAVQAAPAKDDDNPCDQACENVANAQMLLCYTGPFGPFNPICTGEVEDELNACKSLCGNASAKQIIAAKKTRSAVKVRSTAAAVSKRVGDNPLCDETCQNIANEAMILCYTGPFGGVNPICVDTVEAQEEACKVACGGDKKASRHNLKKKLLA